jgi:hypothetical protein
MINTRAEETPTVPPRISPLEPWSGPVPASASSLESRSAPWWEQALLWIPNRVADFLDIFRLDIGAGPAIGGVVRVTRFGQVGYRMMLPVSVRAGLFGREVPVLVEHSNEFGIGPLYVASADRKVCAAEVGAGFDLFIVGGYGGICFEEVADFLVGLLFLDLRHDDWQ